MIGQVVDVDELRGCMQELVRQADPAALIEALQVLAITVVIGRPAFAEEVIRGFELGASPLPLSPAEKAGEAIAVAALRHGIAQHEAVRQRLAGFTGADL